MGTRKVASWVLNFFNKFKQIQDFVPQFLEIVVQVDGLVHQFRAIGALLQILLQITDIRELIFLQLLGVGLDVDFVFGSSDVVGLFQEPGVGEVDDLGFLGRDECQNDCENEDWFEAHNSLLLFI